MYVKPGGVQSCAHQSSEMHDRRSSMSCGAVAGYEPLYKAVGGVWCSRLGMITFILAALLVPLASLLPQTHAIVLPELFLAMAVNSIADLAAYSGSNVLVRPLTGCSAHLLCLDMFWGGHI